MIVLSVLLALAANGWADDRKQERLGRQAREAFSQELRTNRDRIARAIPYHDSLRAAVARADSAGTVHSYDDWRRAFPAFSGFGLADLTASAWQSALGTSAIGTIPFGTVQQLSDAYSIQGKLDSFNASFLPVLDFSDGEMHDTVRKMRVYIETVLSYERYLLAQYDVALKSVERAR